MNSKSRITSSSFDTFQSSCVYGGLDSGQLVMWDVRTNRLPVVKVNSSLRTHCSPIYCLKMIGSRNSNNLVTLSNDGRMCIWSPNKLSEPMKTYDLKFKLE